MWEFLRRWHPVVLLLVGLYLAIPKPAPNPAEIDDEFLAEYDKNGDGVVDKTEFTGFDFAVRDTNDDNVLTTGSMFRWPLHDFKMNLGQDLKGGSSLRYLLIQQDLAEAETSLRKLVEPLAENLEKMSAAGRDKFGPFIRGGELRVGAYNLREGREGTDDFDLLLVTGVFDEGRVDAARRFYTAWQESRQRKDDANLVGPTIETLNRRLNSSGITELNIAPLGDDRIEVKLPQFSTNAEMQRFKSMLESTGKLEMRVLASENGPFRDLSYPDTPRDDGYKYRWLEVTGDRVAASALVKEANGKKWVPVMVIDDYGITGKDLSDIQPSLDNQGQMAVSFSLKGQAVARFENLTSIHREGGEDERLLAVVIDDRVFSAYSIKDKISGSVQLSGRFTAKERDDIINVLKSGSLNVRLKLEGEESVGPSEGAESVKRGLYSFIFSALFVFAFAIFIYRGLGLLVFFNLTTIVVLIMGAMAAGLGTITLPGIAGLVLTFGMAIDGNILINERIREELKRGLGMRSAAEEGFRNALSAIVDSNVTTLLTALILYKVGSGPVQGFALLVAIGIVATLYANVPAYRSLLLGILDLRKGMRFSMVNVNFLENRNINFVAGMKYTVPAGLLFAVLGFALLFNMGSEVLGMEFRGGHTFRMQMTTPMDRDEVASRLIDEESETMKVDWADSVEVQPIYGLGETSEDGKARRFDFRFAMRTQWEGRDQNEVNTELRARLEETFKDTVAAQGWVPSAVDIREVTLSATMQLRLKDPAKFMADRPDDLNKVWLMHDRSWGGNANAPTTEANKTRWWGEVLGNNTAARVVGVYGGLSPAQDSQTYTIRIEALPITSAGEIRDKMAAFQAQVKKYFWESSETVVLDGEAEFKETPTKARPRVSIVFVQPVKVEDVRALALELPQAKTALAGATFQVDAVTTGTAAADGMAQAFTITGSEMTFTSDDTGSFDAVVGAINEAFTDWLKTATPANNELSNPFLLASAIGPTVAGETQVRALLAILSALVILAIYIRLRFASLAWGIAAVVSLMFVVVVTVSTLGLVDALGADMKIDLVVVAAILTVIGYGINDTIVNFDRIREMLRNDRLATGGKTPLKEIVNQAVNMMLPRTLLTSTSTMGSTVIMIFLGGPLLQAFAFTIFVGVVVGTFASVFIAAPVLLLFEKRSRDDLLDLTEDEQLEASEGKAAEGALADESSPAPDEDAGESTEQAGEPKKD